MKNHQPFPINPLLLYLLIMLLLPTGTIQAQFTPATSAAYNLVADNLSNIEHISCDALFYNSHTNTIKVFAWDKKDPSGNQWAYDDGSSMVLMPTDIGVDVIHPEIALVSGGDGTYIWAVLTYLFEYSSGLYGVYYETYEWDGTVFNSISGSTQTVSGLTSSNVVVNVAGDPYGHFIIVSDQGSSGSTFLDHQSGYIDGSGGLNMNTPGTIEFSVNEMMWQADVDITFDNANSAPDDAMVYLAFITKLGQDIFTAAIEIRDLVNNTPWNVWDNHDIIGEIGSECVLDHPSISVNDGYLAYLGSSIPRAAVVFSEPCMEYQNICIFPTTTQYYLNSYEVINNINQYVGALHYDPVVVVAAGEVQAVTAWNFDDNGASSGFLREGLSHLSDWDGTNTIYDPSVYNDLQVETGTIYGGHGTGTTYLTTLSGYDPDYSALYFYYNYDASSATEKVEYLIQPFTANVLRNQATKITDDLNVYPNPTQGEFTISTTQNLINGKIVDTSGRVLFTMGGDTELIIKGMEISFASLDPGIYLLEFQTSERNIVKRIIKN